MSSRSSRLGAFALVVLLLITSVLSGCAGDKARDEVLAPALHSAAPEIVRIAGHAEDADLDALDAFLEASDRGDWLIVQSRWPQVRAWAYAAIDARVESGEIGPGVGDSQRLFLSEYDDQLSKMRGSP